jgi:hypothetical protein
MVRGNDEQWRKNSICIWPILSGCGKFTAKGKWYGEHRWKMLIRGKRGGLAPRLVSLPFCRKNSVSSQIGQRITIPLHPAKPKTQNESQLGTARILTLIQGGTLTYKRIVTQLALIGGVLIFSLGFAQLPGCGRAQIRPLGRTAAPAPCRSLWPVPHPGTPRRVPTEAAIDNPFRPTLERLLFAALVAHGRRKGQRVAGIPGGPAHGRAPDFCHPGAAVCFP